jgi:glucosylceramidase
VNSMKARFAFCLLTGALLITPLSTHAQKSNAQLWLTNADRTALFQKQNHAFHFSRTTEPHPTIEIRDSQTFQTIDGFGFALTWGSAEHLYRMVPAKRNALLKELFAARGKSIGISYLRVSIGASDLNEYVYSYDDVPVGQNDPALTKFSLDEDRKYVIPILKAILRIRPDIKILGSPWSAPAWMKTNNSVKGGNLKPEYYEAYAKYFVKYIQGMKAEGISIDAITIQNEPLNEKNTPSMQLLAPDEAIFIKDHLGPAFRSAGISTRILLYDHNCDLPEYPTSILKDPQANPFVDGSAFHLYGGDISAMSGVHDAYPGKNLYFTEYMAVEHSDTPTLLIAKHVSGTVIAAVRNWSRNVLLWNLAANSKFEPHTDNGGCPICQGALTIEGNDVTRNLAYYTIAHFSKFVRPGSVRIGSDSPETLPSAAFQVKGGKIVLVVANTTASSQTFNVRYHDKLLTTTLQGGAVGTFVL